MLTLLATAALLSAFQHPSDTLQSRLEARIRQTAGAMVGLSYVDLATGRAVHINADSSFHAASTMKVPVMIELFRQVDRRELALDQGMLLKNEFRSIVDGSPYSLSAGDDSDSLVYTKVGQQVPVRELLERMIVRSSNLATNALIEIVDARKADATAKALGARNIRVLRGVEDGKAYAQGLNNSTTSRDMAALMAAIEQGRAASPASTALMRDILMRQEFNEEIPAGLPKGTKVAHKTGFITAHRHDAAIVYPPNGTPYVLVVLTRGVRDEKLQRELIADLSRIVWDWRAGA
ncbi:MAG TPA: serine hydrolase [Gemmatimonadaceae bacterium]|nr:serine hydrolase [Gemmatimonadaceae bacterium]